MQWAKASQFRLYSALLPPALPCVLCPVPNIRSSSCKIINVQLAGSPGAVPHSGQPEFEGQSWQAVRWDRSSDGCLLAGHQPATACHLVGMPKICELALEMQPARPVMAEVLTWATPALKGLLGEDREKRETARGECIVSLIAPNLSVLYLILMWSYTFECYDRNTMPLGKAFFLKEILIA